MSETFRPENEAQVAEAVAWAAAEETPLEVLGRGSKRGLGRPVQSGHGLDLSALSGITLYEPEELVLSAGAATPLAEIEAAIADRNQQLAFEPGDLAPFYGQPAGSGTIGGVLACNLAGPRRIKAGAARDHFLGFRAVSGRGEAFKAGGRVVKNVTGYDLCKLMTGSYGTLAALTEVTVKVLPAAEKTRTVLLLDLPATQAVGAMTRALQSSHEVSGAAHLPADLAAESAVSYVRQAGVSVTAIRVEGPGPSVEHRALALRQELGDLAATEELHSANSATLWRELRNLAPFCTGADEIVWRLSVPPATGATVIDRIVAGLHARYFMDWGGGLIWLALPAAGIPDDAAAAEIRAAVAESGGHATLMRGPEALRNALPVFQPQSAGLAALTRKVKESFDPRGILNPGRMYVGL